MRTRRNAAARLVSGEHREVFPGTGPPRAQFLGEPSTVPHRIGWHRVSEHPINKHWISAVSTQSGAQHAVANPSHSLVRKVLVAPVRAYQVARADRPSPCRHVPSCSTYAIEAIEAHGPVRGLWLGVRRVARCNPWGTSGFDPVPGTGVDGSGGD